MWEENAALAAPPGRTFDMETTAAKQAREKSVNPAALSTQPAPERHMPHGSAPGIPSEKKAIGYGMPCSRCHAYYPADMHICPICKSPDRVSPVAPVVYSVASTVPQPATGAQIDDDRTRFLREHTQPAFVSHTTH